MDLLSHFKSSIKPFLQKGDRVLVAVSGGIDSVVLAELCKQAGIPFAIAHCNFQLRDEESDRDEQFVRSLCKKYNTACFIKNIDTHAFAAGHHLSIQEAARKIRYDYFNEMVKEHDFAFTMLAHHANDQVETVLMNFFRGTGLDGLTGMPQSNRQQARALRPLLNVTRKQISDFAKEHQLKWVEDSSNESLKYTRNFFRNELIPQLKKVYPQVEENIIDNTRRLHRTNNLYQRLVSELKKKICEQRGNELHIPVLKLMQYRDTSILHEILGEFGFSEKQEEEVWRLTAAETGKFVASANYQVIRHRRWLIIAPISSEATTITINEDDKFIEFANGTVTIKKLNAAKISIDASPATALLDARHIQWPLLLRKWKQGDYFYPLGMKKKKKVGRFLIDQKVSKSEKEKTWVLESGNRIVWIAGHRIDDRFKITPSTTNILELILSSP